MSASAISDKLKEIAERGFAVVPGALDREAIPQLRELLEKAIDEDLERWEGKPYVDAWMVHNPMVRAIPFARILEHETMHAYLSALLGETCILYAYTTSSMPPRGVNYSTRIHNDCPRFIPGYATNIGVIFPLDDFTPENGATYFLAGSHLRPERPSEELFWQKAERILPRAGDMVLFNALTYHYGGKNLTDKARHALTLNVCRSFMRQRFDYPRFVSREIVEQLGPLGRRFLGFNVRMPTSLDEYYVPEDQRLYKAGQG